MVNFFIHEDICRPLGRKFSDSEDIRIWTYVAHSYKPLSLVSVTLSESIQYLSFLRQRGRAGSFLQVSVILFTGGRAWSRGGGVWSMGEVPGPGGAGLGGCLVRGGDPPDGHCCWRYASYWNAFLFSCYFQEKLAQNTRLTPPPF